MRMRHRMAVTIQRHWKGYLARKQYALRVEQKEMDKQKEKEMIKETKGTKETKETKDIKDPEGDFMDILTELKSLNKEQITQFKEILSQLKGKEKEEEKKEE